jgi:hypothetical protein
MTDLISKLNPMPLSTFRRRSSVSQFLRRLGIFALAASVVVGPAVVRPVAPIAAQAADEPDPISGKVKGAVDKALAWLAEHQNPDGSWGDRARGQAFSTAVTALSAKAFMARGHIPGQGKYGENLTKGIRYVLSRQQPDGLLSANGTGNASMYEHGIATAMLGEAFGMVDDQLKKEIREKLAKAVKLTLDAQATRKSAAVHQGGWRYTRAAIDADISVTGWQLMALRAAANSGAFVPKESLEAGRDYVRRCAFRGGSGFTYQAQQGTPGPARTGTAIVSLEMLGEHNSKEALAGGDYLLENPVTSPNDNFYYYSVYYISQAFYHLGGKYDKEGNGKLRDSLLASQGPEGTWPQGQGQEMEAGEAYRTSMAVLALCVSFRYLPLFQK